MAKNEALELVKSLRKLLDTVDPRYIHWDKLKREMDDLIAKEEARPQIKMAPKKVTTKPKKGGTKKHNNRGLDYSVNSLK